MPACNTPRLAACAVLLCLGSRVVLAAPPGPPPAGTAADLFAPPPVRAKVPVKALPGLTSSPANACHVSLPLPPGVTLQSALDANQTVVLSQGDYSGGDAFILRSGQRLFGDPAGSIIPPVTIQAGAKGAVLSTLKVGGAVTFPASSTEVTSGCVFERLVCSLAVNGGMLRDNLFLYLNGGIRIDTRASGYVRNNRFIRCKLHASWPQIVMLGDSQRQSYGNVFIWYNFLTPHGDATDIRDQGDLTVVGADAEMWNEKGLGRNALWKVGRMGTLRIFGINGGNHGKNPTGDFDVDADEFQLYNDSMEAIGSPFVDYQLGGNNRRTLLINSSSPGKTWRHAAANPFGLKGFDGGSTGVATAMSAATTPQWTVATGALPPDQQAILRAMVVNPPRPLGQVPWEKPVHGPLPDPVGPGWAADLSDKPDSTARIQGMIDTQGIARLPAGVYYLSKPLKLSRTQGLIGAGADTTVLIAKSPTLDMIVANDPVKTPTGTRIILSDITLQGGGNGIHFEPVGTSANQGRYAQYTDCYFNHVTFRNMRNAGIFMDQIYALDNNFFGQVHFVNCDVGLKQKVDPAYASGENPTMMYMDKCVFYQCQFVGNRLALDLPGRRSCNLNAWINCLFENNRQGAAAMTSYLTTVFANCDFINNGGAAVLSNNYTVSQVSNRFVAGSAGTAMFGGPVSAEGCVFERADSTTASILSGSNSLVFLNNCSAPDMPLGLPANANGMLLNTTLAMDPALNQQAVSIRSGAVNVLLPGTPAPAPQLLVGSDWSQGATPAQGY